MEPPGEEYAKYKWPVLICLLGGVLVVGGLFLTKPAPAKSSEKSSLVKPSQVTIITIKVDVSGAVAHPAVYEFSSGSRVEEAIARAGGFASTVDTSFVSQKLNLSAKLTDGQKLYIPSKTDAQVYSLNQNNRQVAGISTAVVSINSGSLSELDTLPGVGAVTAQKIIDNRPFSSLEELVSRKIVSQSAFDKIKTKISLD